MAANSSASFNTDFFNKYATLPYYLSKGASGHVFGPIPWRGEQLAIKQVLFSNDKSTETITKDIEVKQQIWAVIEHKNLMTIFSVDVSQLPKVLHIVMEFAAGGSLNETLRSLSSKQTKLPIRVVTYWTKQIAEGMLYLLQEKIVHRDLKSSNILLMEPFDVRNPRKVITLKITDFDEVREHDHTTTMSLVGTCAYMAPEVLLNERFSKASDVWSFGVLIWEMLSGDIPYKGLQASEIISKALKGELAGLFIAPSFPEDYKLILEKCWKSTCEERCSFQQILDVLYPPGEQEASYKSDPILVHTIITKSAKAKLPVSGLRITTKQTGAICGRTSAIAILDHELFVVSVNSSKVEVYDSINFDFNRQVHLKDLNEPVDIVSCSRKRFLYILHYKGGVFGILRVDSNGELVKKWSIGVDFGVSLSVTGNGNIIVTVVVQNKLIEYSSDGEFICEIDLSNDSRIRRPACAIKLTNGQFVISHGNGSGGDNLHRVCLVDAGGKVKKSFGGVCGSTNEHLNNPGYLLVDGDGFVMVVDDLNDRVLLFDSNLDFKKVILSMEKHGVEGPMKILLDESTGRLFVADNLWNYKGRILIFECKQIMYA